MLSIVLTALFAVPAAPARINLGVFGDLDGFATPSTRRTGIWYWRAFRRIYLVLHGGSKDVINAKLARLALPRVATDLPSNNGAPGSRWDLGTKPLSRRAYRNLIVPLAG